jgi:molecular chaperone HtpG
MDRFDSPFDLCQPAGIEIDPTHPAVQRLKYEETRFDDWANLLLEQATLAEGGTLDDPAGFVKRINDLMLALSLGSGR